MYNAFNSSLANSAAFTPGPTQKSKLLSALNGTPSHSSLGATSNSNPNTSALLASLNGVSAASNLLSGASSYNNNSSSNTLHGSRNDNGNGRPASPTSAAQLDPWSVSSNGASHLPLSISQSINNPGLPSGVIVSSAAVNAMNGISGASAGSALGGSAAGSRAETPGGQPSQLHHQGGGGKLLSLVQPGSLPGNGAQSENEKVYYLIVDLMSPTTREGALLELSKKREQWDDLALVLWHSFGVMSALLQEIVSVYPLLAPPSLTAHASNRVCNALALLQCVASHNDTRSLFLSAHIPLFLYPFLNTTSKTRPFEYLRLTSLGVIGALVKQNDNSDVINFLLSTEIIPLCLRIMETGSELSKTVAIFIVQKILLDEMGLGYICQTYERFYAVGTVLSNMVQQLVESQAVRLLKHVVRCYLRLSDNLRAREALRACLPEPLRDATFSPLLKGDMVTKRCLATLLLNLSDRVDS
ncbi:BZ3500_MvSof-1268-A1-R1_Chr3-1g05536 [Microbotryum saponariae]|uniref:BZ3500_MvSof-1268-A1-R1_Chr3-1g05536 protein n=1 Tax=Microbotryum saponariae TaxID=289078 RepID=A0A2X0NHT0_9BASI|nr:BZ3500_MvSof-1268-A1-R1_Chr3-1g05536 [Microbotryum saponariae]SDA04727.1 BZ3501_MvSof-1269-A2-R1_Chr3-1g05207 [Microbotryum saponariae]